MSFRFPKYILCFFVVVAFLSAPSLTYAQKREVPDSVVQKMQKDKDFRYANDSSFWKDEEYQQRTPNALEKFLVLFARSAFLKVLLYLLLAAALMFAVYHILVVNNFFSFSRRRRRAGKEEDNIHDDINENIDSKLAAAVEAKNYREAVRFMFLRTLKNLSENNLITLHAKSTNRDYLQQMNKHNSGGQFRNLTRIYEYVWYGEFQPNELQFEMISSQFNQFHP